MGLADYVDISWGLYGQSMWKWRQQRIDIINSGIVGYDKKVFPSDGYTLYFDMKFNFLKNEGDTIGIALPLPNGDGTDTQGFGWIYSLHQNKYYDFSFY